jgi:hypothetical protein
MYGRYYSTQGAHAQSLNDDVVGEDALTTRKLISMVLWRGKVPRVTDMVICPFG